MDLDELNNKVAITQRVMAPHMGQPLDWEKRHCALIAREIVKEITGVDLYPNYAINANTKKSLIKAYVKAGSVASVLDAAGFKKIDKWEAEAGDILELPSEDETLPCIAIAMGAGAAAAFVEVTPGHRMLVSGTVGIANNAWRIEKPKWQK